jgi:hypothetical protein
MNNFLKNKQGLSGLEDNGKRFSNCKTATMNSSNKRTTCSCKSEKHREAAPGDVREIMIITSAMPWLTSYLICEAT